MSEGRFLLIFLGGAPGWLRLADGGVVARGSELAAIPPPGDEQASPERVALIVPGPDVAIHWAEIPANLTPAQALGAARIMASEVSAQPLADAHIALGPPVEGNGERCLAIVDSVLMGAWLADAQALGYDPERVIPEPLLIAPPDEGVRLFGRAGLDNVRGPRRAFAAEPDLARLLLAGELVETIDADAFEAGLAEAVLAAPVNLRQGTFAKQRRWRIDPKLVWRLIALGALILLATLLIQLTLLTKYSFAADALEREAIARARDVIPGNVEIVDPGAQLRAQLAEAGGGPSWRALAGAVFGAIRATPESELQSLVYAEDGALRLTIAAPSQAALDALTGR
ncbi:MAG: general secretion pathway protein GspL, partial [Sphingomonadaceae bacterium]|nr:general secretion pathway protein GspL [Sphingomonadaceae bacterium]